MLGLRGFRSRGFGNRRLHLGQCILNSFQDVLPVGTFDNASLARALNTQHLLAQGTLRVGAIVPAVGTGPLDDLEGKFLEER